MATAGQFAAAPAPQDAHGQAAYQTLWTGQKIPVIGLGFWKQKETYEVARNALDVVSRLFDTAAEYENEADLGKALHEALQLGKVSRDDLFVETKLWNADHNRVEEAFEESRKALGLEQLDAYLMHWPVPFGEGHELDPPLQVTYQRMEEVVDAGKTKSIGLSNFSVKKLKAVLSYARIKPAILQIEKFRKPGDPSVFGNPTVLEVAKAVGKTPAQVCLRWNIQRGCVVIPKSSSTQHLKENLEVLDFELGPQEMEQLSSIDFQKRFLSGYQFTGKDWPFKNASQIWDGEGEHGLKD